MKNEPKHEPVLLKEVVGMMNISPGGKYIDATLGFGGHTKALLKQGANVLSIEWDPEILAYTKKHIAPFLRGTACPNASWQPVAGNFAQIKAYAQKYNFIPVDGILFDLGISRWHYKEANRGFAFNDEKLDMKLNPKLPKSAYKIVNTYSYNQLYELFAQIAQEPEAGAIASQIVKQRKKKKISSARALSQIVHDIYQKRRIRSKTHPATRVFLSLRIEVNQELKNLKTALKHGFEILKPGGRILSLSFNSSEDRLVKIFFKQKEKQGKAKLEKLIFPSDEEIKNNALARSAKLRVLIKK